MLKEIKIVILFILLCCLPTVLLAGITGKISGNVTDVSSGYPLADASIIIVNTNMMTVTDPHGDYFIINVPPDTYTVEARINSYTTLLKSGVIVRTDHTTQIDFSLKETLLENQEATAAEPEVILQDITESRIVAASEDILEIPFVQDISDFINLQVGIEENVIRGGDLESAALMMDGLMVVDNRINRPVMNVNLSSIQELNVIKGGFNAEYGNVRSGLFNIVTKEGDADHYHGSVDFRFTPAHLKHGGESIYSPDNFNNRAYLDPDVCWDGTNKTAETNTIGGYCDEYAQQQNQEFVGWNQWVTTLKGITMTPEEARELYIWEHLIEGCDTLGQKPNPYGDKPDYNIDIGFGGPVPLIGKYLGNATFFLSTRGLWEAFILPRDRDYYEEKNTSLKITSHLHKSIKVSLEGIYTDIRDESGGSWDPHAGQPWNQYNTLLGFGLDHVLSNSTFYNLRVSWFKSRMDYPEIRNDRDTTIVRHFGDVGVTEAPWGTYGWNDTFCILPP
ncbi:Plug and carboxypeptidase regulatory-like domain-containing protein, partial [bacterium]|nr:Plug and carboxypeptidase regulatory-like domain-containing protein [bacterium]